MRKFFKWTFESISARDEAISVLIKIIIINLIIIYTKLINDASGIIEVFVSLIPLVLAILAMDWYAYFVKNKRDKN